MAFSWLFSVINFLDDKFKRKFGVCNFYNGANEWITPFCCPSRPTSPLHYFEHHEQAIYLFSDQFLLEEQLWSWLVCKETENFIRMQIVLRYPVSLFISINIQKTSTVTITPPTDFLYMIKCFTCFYKFDDTL